MNVLAETAETAKDIAAGFNQFIDRVPEYSTEITALISKCFAVNSALRELDTAIGDSRYNRRYLEIRDDVRMTLQSLQYTFNDVRRHFGNLPRTTRILDSPAYRAVWWEITTYFQEESSNSLHRRLEFYCRFLLALAFMAEGLATLPTSSSDRRGLTDWFLGSIQTPTNMTIFDFVSIAYSKNRMIGLRAICTICR